MGGKRLRMRWLLLATALIIVAIVVVLSRAHTGGTRGASTSATPGRGGDTTTEVTLPATPFSMAADSLAGSLEAFARRQADFEAGRIDCAALALGYARVDERMLALAQERVARYALSPHDAAVFDSLMSEAAAADRLFDGTGCPRP